MLPLGTISFATPWVLAALAALPALFWLLRAMPPAPREIRFPAIRLLQALASREETPARTPLWLVLLRVALAGLLILGFAGPLLDAPAGFTRTGPLVLVIDNGWEAGRDWAARMRVLTGLLDQAEREGRRVVLAETAPPPGEAPPSLSFLRPTEAKSAAGALLPRPWPTDRKAALERIDALARESGTASANIVWLSDGTDPGDAAAFAWGLSRLGGLRVLTPPSAQLARLLVPAENGTEGLAFTIRRAAAAVPETPSFLRLLGEDGRLLAREEARFSPGETATTVRIDLPAELRNRAVRAEIEGEDDAGGTLLLDERWRRRPVGLVAPSPDEKAQPLLTGTYYLDKALAPFTLIRKGAVADLLKEELAVMALADRAPAGPAERAALKKWLEQGGILLRFAGPGLVDPGEEGAAEDDLLPVRLRRGGRTIGGALSWEQPAHLAPFPETSPFAGLPVPDEITVSKQVLAEPALDLGEKSWALLADGTPLVTAARRGKGLLVLIHTGASPEWSNLPLSGLFVQMLRRIVAAGKGVSGEGETPLPPFETLDGWGRLGQAPSTARPLPPGESIPSRLHPPGYYGTEDTKRALNLHAAIERFAAIGALPEGVERGDYGVSAGTDLRPPLLAGAFLLLLADLLIAFRLRGLLAASPRLALVLAPLVLFPPVFPARAASGDDFARKATAALHLAYIRTGVPDVDSISRAGLAGLTAVLNQRTSVEAAEPMEVDPETDDLVFFPLLYWPIAPGQAEPSPRAAERLNRYLQSGGTILFDSRDPQGSAALPRGLVAGLAVPPLAPVSPDHVLTRSFYLLNAFPGRWNQGEVWAEQASDRVNDGVAAVIVGANDWAGAWAIGSDGGPVFPVVPGGERQRELAYRFGVNLVMYTLTGNYKADQVHVPAILERLGK